MTCFQPIELTVSLQEAFPRKLLKSLASESKLVIRERDFDPVIFFWALMGTIIAGKGASVASVLVEYERLAKRKYDASTFYQRIGSPAMLLFVRVCFEHACKSVFPPGAVPAYFMQFVDVLLQDSSVVRLRNKLAGRLPGSATAAALKVNVVVSIGGGAPAKVRLAAGTKAESKLAFINATLAGCLIIGDLGYYCHQHFARIQDNEGYFISRLKDNADPRIVSTNLKHRGQALDLAGRRIREVLGDVKRNIFDVMAEFEVTLKGQPGPIPVGGHQLHKRRWRIVGLRNAETGEYHIYVTNVPPEMLTAEEIALSYSQRWQVELLFKELKGAYDLGAWGVASEEGVMTQTYATLIAWALSRKLRSDILGEDTMKDPKAASLAAPLLRFAKVLGRHIGAVIDWMFAGRRAPRHIVALIRRQVRDPNRGRRALNARLRRVPRNAPVAAYAG